MLGGDGGGEASSTNFNLPSGPDNRGWGGVGK